MKPLKYLCIFFIGLIIMYLFCLWAYHHEWIIGTSNQTGITYYYYKLREIVFWDERDPGVIKPYIGIK